MAGASQSCSVGTALDTVRDALHSAGQLIRPRGTDALMASCPLHTDHTPSLSVTWRESTPAGPQRRGAAALLQLPGGAADIAAALGLRVADLFDNPAPPATQRNPLAPRRRAPRPTRTGPLPPRITVDHRPAQHQWRQVRVYTYTTADGRPVQQVIRQECGCGGRTHKRFQQRYRHDRRWVYRKPAGFTPGLYRAGAIAGRRRSPDMGVHHRRGKRRRHPHRLGTSWPPPTPKAQRTFHPRCCHSSPVCTSPSWPTATWPATNARRPSMSTSAHIAAQVVVLVAGLDSHKADVTDHVNAGLWKPDEPFGGLVEVTISDLQALTAAAVARDAADLFAVALAEAQAHQGRQAAYANSASAAARWLTEAAHQLNTVRRSDQRPATPHNRTPVTDCLKRGRQTVAALRARTEDTWRHRAPTRPATSPQHRRSTRQPAA